MRDAATNRKDGECGADDAAEDSGDKFGVNQLSGPFLFLAVAMLLILLLHCSGLCLRTQREPVAAVEERATVSVETQTALPGHACGKEHSLPALMISKRTTEQPLEFAEVLASALKENHMPWRFCSSSVSGSSLILRVTTLPSEESTHSMLPESKASVTETFMSLESG